MPTPKAQGPSIVAQRVLERLAQLGLKPTPAANQIGKPDGFFHDLKLGRKKSVGTDVLPALVTLLDCDLEYLLGVQDEPRRPRPTTIKPLCAGSLHPGAWLEPSGDPWAGRPTSATPDPRHPLHRQQVFHHVTGSAPHRLEPGSMVWITTEAHPARAGDRLVVEQRRDDLTKRQLAILEDGPEPRLALEDGTTADPESEHVTVLGRVIMIEHNL